MNNASATSLNPYNSLNSTSSDGFNPSLRMHGITVDNSAPDPGTVSGGAYTGPLAGLTIGGDPFALFLGVVLAIMIIKWAMERADLGTSYIHVGPLNFVIIALSAWVGAVGIRLLLNLYPIPGLTQLANFGA